jgi:motility quorum-sensing regulator/GCU-specific mRNA interferase toxin
VSEKRTPTYDIETIKQTFSSSAKLNMTTTALRSSAAIGFGKEEIVATIQTMQRSHFYKSMTSKGNHRIWQDVYHTPFSDGILYIKFVADTVTEFLLLSFKEKDNG